MTLYFLIIFSHFVSKVSSESQTQQLTESRKSRHPGRMQTCRRHSQRGLFLQAGCCYPETKHSRPSAGGAGLGPQCGFHLGSTAVFIASPHSLLIISWWLEDCGAEAPGGFCQQDFSISFKRGELGWPRWPRYARSASLCPMAWETSLPGSAAAQVCAWHLLCRCLYPSHTFPPVSVESCSSGREAGANENENRAARQLDRRVGVWVFRSSGLGLFKDGGYREEKQSLAISYIGD